MCIYKLLTNIQLKKSLKNCYKKLPVGIYPPLRGETLIFYLLKHEYISEVVPLHSRSRHRENQKDLFQEIMHHYEAPIDEIKDYYGESVAIYFEWCNYMARWLFFPSVLALALFFYETFIGTSALSLYYNSLFSFGMAIYAPLLVTFWQRRCAELEVVWDNYKLDVRQKSYRQQFKGEIYMDPITDKETLHYPKRERLMRYIESFFIALPFMTAAMFVMLSCLNMMGYSDKNDYFYMSAFAALSEKDAIFEKGSMMAMIPSILMTVTMAVIGKFFEPAAQWATDRENHKTHEGHRNSVNIKKFVFNFIFFFSHLFYVAFERRDMQGLKKELITLALVDELRRIVAESALPAFLQKRQGLVLSKCKPSIVEEELDELQKPKYTYFEDYLELVIQYGYITMFAAAFPLGSFFNYLFLFFERRSDAYKIERLCRRPLSVSASDIGIWDDIMKLVSYMSVFTNLFLFAFADRQIDEIGVKRSECANSHYFIGIENSLIVIILILRLLVSKKPKWVKIFMKRADTKERREFVLQNAISKIKSAVTKVKGMNRIINA